MTTLLLIALLACGCVAHTKKTIEAEGVTAMDGKAQKTKKTFSMTHSVAIKINAEPATIWTYLGDGSTWTTWNSTIEKLEGEIVEGQKVHLTVKIAPERVFKLKVAEVVPNERIVWKDGAAPMFSGQRTYTLEKQSDGSTVFRMTEVMGGIMAPMVLGQIPDMKQAFEDFAADLKTAAEGSTSS